MKLKRRIIMLAVLFVTAIGMSVKAVSEIKPETKDNNIPKNSQIASAESDDAKYYLRDCDGYIAVFSGESSAVPIDVTDIEVQTLNETDRELLSFGIPAENKTELLTLLEDLGS